jgi:hypothetical protein
MTGTLRVYAHVIRKSADGVAATFAAAVSAEIEVEDQGDEDDPGAPAVLLPRLVRSRSSSFKGF